MGYFFAALMFLLGFSVGLVAMSAWTWWRKVKSRGVSEEWIEKRLLNGDF